VTTNLVLWGLGVVLVAVGYVRAREPWRRYQALREQQANVDRYEAWRGRASVTAAGGPSGADVAIAMYRRQTQIWAGVAIVGFLLVFAGFAIR
jgi:hypothetical protein